MLRSIRYIAFALAVLPDILVYPFGVMCCDGFEEADRFIAERIARAKANWLPLPA